MTDQATVNISTSEGRTCRTLTPNEILEKVREINTALGGEVMGRGVPDKINDETEFVDFECTKPDRYYLDGPEIYGDEDE